MEPRERPPDYIASIMKSMFSARLHWNLQPNPISQRIARKRAEGKHILDLTESNPTQAGIPYPAEEILAAFSNPRLLEYAPDPAGLASAREAVAHFYYEDSIPASRLLLTTSTSEAYGFLFKLLTDPGDRILVPRPSYPLFEFLAGMELVEADPYPLFYEGGWRMDCKALAEAVTPRTRVVVLVNPNNPTGSFLKASELEQLTALCRDRGLAIICDEVFSDYAFGECPGRVPSLADSREVLTFCLSGLSKSAGLPQMKLGWIVTCGPEEERHQAMSRLELIADTYLSVGAPVQYGAAALLQEGRKIRAAIATRTARNLAWLKTQTGGSSPFRLLDVEGGWYAIVEAPRVHTEEEWILELLDCEDVLLQPGFFYDFEREAFLVASLLTSEPMFQEGISRVARFASMSV